MLGDSVSVVRCNDGTYTLERVTDPAVPLGDSERAAVAALVAIHRTNADRLIQCARDATGLSAVALSRVLGIDRPTLWRWLAGRRAMPGPARALCYLLWVHPELVDDLAPPLEVPSDAEKKSTER